MIVYKLDDYSAYGAGLSGGGRKMFYLQTLIYLLMVSSILLLAPIFIIGASLHLYPLEKLSQPLIKFWKRFVIEGQFVSWQARTKKYSFRKILKPIAIQVYCVAGLVIYGFGIACLFLAPIGLALFSGLAVLFNLLKLEDGNGLIKIIIIFIWCTFFITVLVYDSIKFVRERAKEL